ncbi:MAG: glycosyltransferase family 9 protein [Saprospiraceae bacterium]|nr:glycosyltransferase family 9 protein [Saprospiraceae bacterium]MCF8249544.1 glycosyltransferase family 9 protein [Saprospiraceae bacterium]MCF8281294.1 glycosyltransferase family 9 protein [Bacteroidales bacterium]MCF8310762.1 glycosyltransferase family 9 protein [Saprospiraceae bacterium]MCF8439407.1 glycosyltransferase family 9 protein [Saprospiraceae bacterium]
MKKILIIRFSSIGDIVLTTPVVRCLKQQLGAEIHYLTKQQFLPLLEANSHIDRIFTIKKNVSEVLPDLRREGYDYVVDLHKNLRTLRVRIGLLFQPKWLTFKKLNVEKWLLTALKINRLPKLHIVDRYLAATEPLGIKNDGQGLDFFVPQHLHPSYPIPHTSYFAFAIGAKFQTKRLPTAKIVEICQQLHQPILLLGGKEEAAEGEIIAEQSGSHVSNLCGKLSLQESAEVLRRAVLVITHDTGMMHIAAAFQQKVLSIWGNTVPALGMAPYYGTANPDRNTSFEVEGLSCRPCSKIGYQTCPKGHFKCMNEQDVEKIVRQAAL